MIEAFLNEMYSDDFPEREIGRCECDLKEADNNHLEIKRMYIFNIPDK